MKKLLVIAGLILAITTSSVASVSAHGGDDDSDRNRSDRWNRWHMRGGVLGIKDWKITAENCPNVQDKIAKRSESIKQSIDRKVVKYERVVERVNLIIAKAEEQGLDTTELTANVEELQTKIANFKLEILKLQEKLAEASTVDCESETGPDQLQVILQEARIQLKLVRETSKAIHSYLRETLIPNLRELKQQLEDASESE
jgi:hypothetical protein